jgi:hypothetical protein
MGEVHADGRIMGGALWNLRRNLPRTGLSDTLWHYTRYAHARSFDDYCY